MDFFPVFAKLQDRTCLVVGGGEVAARKTEMLLRAGARVIVNAPQLGEVLQTMAADGRVTWKQRDFDASLIDQAFLVVAATDSPWVNRAVSDAADLRHRLVNVVDEGDLCSYISPAVVDRSPLVVAISTGGTMPVLGKRIRERLESWLPARLGRLARLAGGMRDQVKQRLPDLKVRRRFWESLLDGAQADRVYAAADDAAESALGQALEHFGHGELRGRVYLVGAGPGDPGLLTLRALQVMQQADVILHDRLVSTEVLDLARRDAERVDVGKQAGCHPVHQGEINQLLVEHARRGLKVVRLKGGDPFIFGRGGEELQVLAEAGIDFEVVPGITAALACGAYSGIPLTHRDLAQQVVFATAHGKDEHSNLNWAALAQPAQTRVFYMPVKRLHRVRERLMQHELPGDTPIAIIENGTRSNQRVIRGRLAELAELAEDNTVQSPAILVVGEVAALHDSLAWFQPQTAEPEPLPLAMAV